MAVCRTASQAAETIYKALIEAEFASVIGASS